MAGNGGRSRENCGRQETLVSNAERCCFRCAANAESEARSADGRHQGVEGSSDPRRGPCATRNARQPEVRLCIWSLVTLVAGCATSSVMSRDSHPAALSATAVGETSLRLNRSSDRSTSRSDFISVVLIARHKGVENEGRHFVRLPASWKLRLSHDQMLLPHRWDPVPLILDRRATMACDISGKIAAKSEPQARAILDRQKISGCSALVEVLLQSAPKADDAVLHFCPCMGSDVL